MISHNENNSSITDIQADIEIDPQTTIDNKLEEKGHKLGNKYNEGKYAYKVDTNESGKDIYKPIFMGLEFPGVESPEELMTIFHAIEKLNTNALNTFEKSGSNDKFYTAEWANIKDLYIDNTPLGHITTDTLIINNEKLQELFNQPKKYVDKFLDIYDDFLNLYTKNLAKKEQK